MNLILLGDISLNNNYEVLWKRKENPFKELSLKQSSSDIVIGNLECLARGKNHLDKKGPILATGLQTIGYLKNISVDIISLANNHVYDNLEKGFDRTVKYLTKSGIKYLGAGEAKDYLDIKLNSKTVRIIVCVEKKTGIEREKDVDIAVAFFEHDRIRQLVKESSADINILYIHWGCSDHSWLPTYKQVRLARLLSKLNLDYIIGHHSHTIQPVEEINSTKIFYSLGNFCFDDIAIRKDEFQVLDNDRHRRGMYVELDVVSRKLNRRYIENNQCYLINCNQPKHLRWYQFLFDCIKINGFIYNVIYHLMNSIRKVNFYFFGNNRNPLSQLFRLPKKVLERI